MQLKFRLRQVAFNDLPCGGCVINADFKTECRTDVARVQDLRTGPQTTCTITATTVLMKMIANEMGMKSRPGSVWMNFCDWVVGAGATAVLRRER